MPMHTHIDTGWRRPIGCLKPQVSFRKRAINHRAILRKETYKDRLPMSLRHPVRYVCSEINIFPTTHVPPLHAELEDTHLLTNHDCGYTH